MEKTAWVSLLIAAMLGGVSLYILNNKNDDPVEPDPPSTVVFQEGASSDGTKAPESAALDPLDEKISNVLADEALPREEKSHRLWGMFQVSRKDAGAHKILQAINGADALRLTDLVIGDLNQMKPRGASGIAMVALLGNSVGLPVEGDEEQKAYIEGQKRKVRSFFEGQIRSMDDSEMLGQYLISYAQIADDETAWKTTESLMNRSIARPDDSPLLFGEVVLSAGTFAWSSEARQKAYLPRLLAFMSGQNATDKMMASQAIFWLVNTTDSKALCDSATTHLLGYIGAKGEVLNRADVLASEDLAFANFNRISALVTLKNPNEDGNTKVQQYLKDETDALTVAVFVYFLEDEYIEGLKEADVNGLLEKLARKTANPAEQKYYREASERLQKLR